MRIGVLALQGAFREHLDTLAAIGVEGVRVREPADLEGVSGLILPGGESTTMRQLIERWGLRQPILDLARSGAPIFGTCAGMIVLARDIAGEEEPILPLLDVRVERNAFGRQLDSFEADLPVDVLGSTPVHGVFIRAPVIERTGPDVDVLARLDDGRVVAVREGVLHRTLTVVPHAKAQSVRLSQGPVQRRLGLATVHVDTTPGPVDAVIRHRPQSQARRIVEEQAERSRLARRADVPEQWMSKHYDGDGTTAASIEQNGSTRVPHHDEEQDPPRDRDPG
jgi:5'-phosphate synthase pdxT subunit